MTGRQASKDESEIEVLSRRLDELNSALEENRNLYVLGDDSVLADNRKLAVHHACLEIREISLLFSLVRDFLRELMESNPLMQEGNQRPLLHRYVFLTQVLPILVKACLQGLDNVENILTQKGLTKLLDQGTAKELKRLMVYRDKAIVHKNPLGAISGLRVGGADGRIEMMSFGIIPSELHERTHALFEKCSPFLPEEVRGEVNSHEQLGLIYRNLTLITDGVLVREVKNVIGNFGVISPQPSEIVANALSILRDLAAAGP